MLRVEELERLMVDLESHRVERKQAPSDPEKIRQAICAFANDLPATSLPGYLFIGVDDSGVPTGKPITDQNLLTLADMRSDGNILPPPRMNVSKVELRGASVAVGRGVSLGSAASTIQGPGLGEGRTAPGDRHRG